MCLARRWIGTSSPGHRRPVGQAHSRLGHPQRLLSLILQRLLRPDRGRTIHRNLRETVSRTCSTADPDAGGRPSSFRVRRIHGMRVRHEQRTPLDKSAVYRRRLRIVAVSMSARDSMGSLRGAALDGSVPRPAHMHPGAPRARSTAGSAPATTSGRRYPSFRPTNRLEERTRPSPRPRDHGWVGAAPKNHPYDFWQRPDAVRHDRHTCCVRLQHDLPSALIPDRRHHQGPGMR